MKRPGASATLLRMRGDDLVDNARDMILTKYANSLGRTFDSPDLVVRVATCDVQDGQGGQAVYIGRVLAPEEEICRTIDSYYPTGQTVYEALIIEVPTTVKKRLNLRSYPQACQRDNCYGNSIGSHEPGENEPGYYAMSSPTEPLTMASPMDRANQSRHCSSVPVPPHGSELYQSSTAVLGMSRPSQLPSAAQMNRHRRHLPWYARNASIRPTDRVHALPRGLNAVTQLVNPARSVGHPLAQRATRCSRRGLSTPKAQSNSLTGALSSIPTLPALKTLPRAHSEILTPSMPHLPSQGTTPMPVFRRLEGPWELVQDSPISRSQHRHGNGMARKMLDGLVVGSPLDKSVPLINVLVVEDNIMNLRVLEGLMKGLHVRWHTAVNGQNAVDCWKKGGYHLILMEMQMPVIDGLQATREIRRLELFNGIGGFSETEPTPDRLFAEEEISKARLNSYHADSDSTGAFHRLRSRTDTARDCDADMLNVDNGDFKSPIVIVALTAAVSQSDRQGTLAAGCNDLDTKPIDPARLKRKVKEWGCMQALIDFDGLRL